MVLNHLLTHLSIDGGNRIGSGAFSAIFYGRKWL
jgi:hypothetical protein